VREQGRGDQADRRDGDRAADRVSDPVRHRLHERALRVRGRAARAGRAAWARLERRGGALRLAAPRVVHREVGGASPEPLGGDLTERYRLLELNVEPLVPVEEHGRRAEETPQALLLLLGPRELAHVARGLDELLVVDRDRHEHDVVRRAIEPGVDLHRDEAASSAGGACRCGSVPPM
jgi:hypothetical protein